MPYNRQKQEKTGRRPGICRVQQWHFKVGKYGVDVGGFERDVAPILDVSRSDAELFVTDEIGKMECFSNRLVAAVRKLFASDRSVLATVAQKGSGLISDVKVYPGSRL